MKTVFVEVQLIGADLRGAGIDSRDELEDPLDDALSASGLGQVTGGGGGSGRANIDIELAEESFEEGLRLVQLTLRKHGAPPSTVVKRYQPTPIEYRLGP